MAPRNPVLTRLLPALLAGSSFLVGMPALAQGQDRDLGQEVKVILAERCVSCHSAESSDRKARKRFDYAHDLERVIEKYVTAGEPEDSELWICVDEGEMPPDDSDVLPLDQEQRESLVSWISAGAPLPHKQADSEVPAPNLVGEGAGNSGQESVAEEALNNDPAAGTPGASMGVAQPSNLSSSPSSLKMDLARLTAFAGKCHPLAVHLPIGMLLGAALAEMMLLLGGRSSMREVVRFCILIGSLSAVAAAVLGWLNASNVSIPEEDLQLHRWTGVAFSIFTCVLLFQSERTARAEGHDADGFEDTENHAPRVRLRLMLLFAVLLMSAAGHFGGELVYGEDYLSL